MSTEKEKKTYRVLHSIIKVIVRLFYRVRYVGLENISAGAMLVCGNHSSWIDPFFLAFALDKSDILHMMAKAELFKIPVVRSFITCAGAFPVDRSKADFGAVKKAMRYLKGGEKVGIFPEGTRSKSDDTEAKIGAIKIAEATKVPILPVYIPRDKKLFRPFYVVIGTPYTVNKSKDRSEEYYRHACSDLMGRISGLKEVRV